MLDISISYPDGPGDVRGLKAWLDRLPKRDVSKLIVFGKTEGPATLNDFSRDVAQAATDAAIGEADRDLLTRSWRLFSTGCEGIASPIMIMMAEIAGPGHASSAIGLAVGLARSEPLPAYPRCGLDHVEAAALTVDRAIKNAGLRPDQVALVLIKSPILIPGSLPAGVNAGARHVGSTGSSRGAAAMGAGIALGEIDRATLSDDPVCRDAVFATRVMSFSGIETDAIEVVVLGERPGGDPNWGIASTLISDFLDADGIARLRAVAGPNPELVYFKAGIAPDGRLRGRRTTVLSSDLSADKQLRGAASGFVAAHFGTANAFISGGAEHQAPHGGCLCAALFRR
jgi:cyanuric acid amidohydrolase